MTAHASIEEIRTFLSNQGRPIESGDIGKARLMEVIPLSKDRAANVKEANGIACHIEALLVARQTCNLNLAVTTYYLQSLVRLRPSKLALVIASTYPDHVSSPSWVTKLIKAGELLATWPELNDIESIEKLATLHRVPKKLQKQVFSTGRLPNGTAPFRSLSRDRLAAEVARLLPFVPGPTPEEPFRVAKKELIKLVTQFRPAIELLATLPHYQSIGIKLLAWQNELSRMIVETPTFIPKALGLHHTTTDA